MAMKTNETFNEEVRLAVGIEYDFLERYKGAGIKINVRHNRCGSVYLVSPSHFLNGRRCPKCRGVKKKTTEEFQKEVESVTRGLYEVKGKYKNAATKINILHIKCGNEFLVTPNAFLSKGKRCDYCIKPTRKLKNNIDTIEQYFKQVGLSLCHGQEYTGYEDKLNCFCEKHGIVQQTFKAVKYNKRGCPECGRELGITNRNINTANTNRILTIEEASIGFYERGLVLLDTLYINNSTKMRCWCPKHETELFMTYASISNGSGCFLCGRESSSFKQRKSANEVHQLFDSKGFVLEDNYINGRIPLRCRCKKHLDKVLYISYDNLRDDKHGCKYCWNERRGGENYWNWKGGISPIHAYLRTRISPWKKESEKQCDWKCIITGDTNYDIHHLYGFDLILNETLNITDIEILPSVADYTDKEKDFLVESFLEIHNRYPLGVCLREDIHSLFHSLYGFGGNTPEQFEEFRYKYERGEFIAETDKAV